MSEDEEMYRPDTPTKRAGGFAPLKTPRSRLRAALASAAVAAGLFAFTRLGESIDDRRAERPTSPAPCPCQDILTQKLASPDVFAHGGSGRNGAEGAAR